MSEEFTTFITKYITRENITLLLSIIGSIGTIAGWIYHLISQGLIPRSSAAIQTNDERSESWANTPQLCCGEVY